jgi:oligosaccharide repeat unit polymerase
MTEFANYYVEPDDSSFDDQPPAPPQRPLEPLPRAKWTILPFFLPLFICGFSWMSGGIPIITDMGFILLTSLCFIYLLFEVRSFTRRFGMGAFVLLGGTLVWYCHDYFSNWFGKSLIGNELGYSPETIAKGAFFTTLFVTSAFAGLLWIPAGRRVLNLVQKIPEPPSPILYFAIILITLFLGMIPYLFFTTGSLFTNLFYAMTAIRNGTGAAFTVGRSGNYNYNWGGYLAQLTQIGQTGGVLAAFYVIFVPRGSIFTKSISFFIWLFWSAIAFGGGSRGEFLFVVLPIALLLFIKYMNIAADYLKRFSPRAVIYASSFLLAVLFVVQIQGSFRGQGASQIELGEVSLFKNQGNAMFSEGLIVYQYFPDAFPFVEDNFLGERFLMPIPDVITRWGIGWIPRALWHGKPGATAASLWINATMSGGTAANEEGSDADVAGGTVTTSICGAAYMTYGWAGVVEMGLLFGWLCKFAERALWENLRRPLATMFCLGTCAYLIRSFRDLTPHDFYPLAIGVLTMSLVIWSLQPFTGRAPSAGYLPEVAPA